MTGTRRLLPILVFLSPISLPASSHMDAPLITLDDAANLTDVYAFVSTGEDGTKYLTAAMSVYPFEEPGIGPNKYNFDDDVLYEIHVSLGKDIQRGRPTLSYGFRFDTTYKSVDTILQSYLGVIDKVDDGAQNLTQTYRVTCADRRRSKQVRLGSGIVPPNNQGIATPHYNVGEDGNNPAKDGVAREADLDSYTAMTIAQLNRGYRSFAGQREDGFYANIQGIFDLLQLGLAFDSQSGFNVHTIVLQIPVSELGGDLQTAGVFATTSRRKVTVLSKTRFPSDLSGPWVQVGRLGNPLFCEGLVAIKDKDLYNRKGPHRDSALFATYAENPELAKLLNLILLDPDIPGIETGRVDIASIFIPDLIKVDLSTGPARLAGGGAGHATNPDDEGFSRLGIFGGDVLTSQIQEGFGGGALPGGWPNGRRFGDDVVDIAVTALISDLRVSPPVIRGAAGDSIDKNDAVYSKVMPYAGTPHNGRNHGHD